MMLLLLVACAHRTPAPPIAVDCPGEDPALLARAQALELAEAVSVPFDIRIRTADKTVNAHGTLLVAPPSKFRMEVSGPIGPPQLVVASDGTSLGAYLAGRRVFISEPRADAAIERVTGGALDLGGAVGLLLGTLPTVAAGVGQTSVDRRVVWNGARGSAEFTLDCAGEILAVAARDASGREVVSAAFDPGPRYPRQLTANVAPLGAEVQLAYGSWKPAAPPAGAFTLSPPPGFEVRELGAVLDSGAPPPAVPGTP